MSTALHAAETTLDALERLADAGLPAQDLLDQATERMFRVVPTEGHFVGATDPETLLTTGMGVVRDLPADMCRPTWDYEFLVPRRHQVRRHRPQRPIGRRRARR